MPTPLPVTADQWLAEVLAAMAAAQQEAADSDDGGEEADAAWLQFLEEQAVILARAARGLADDRRGLERALSGMDALTDATVALRRYAPGDPEDHHITEVQHFLLYYVAAHRDAQLLSQDAAGAVVHECWELARQADENEFDDLDQESDAEDDDDPSNASDDVVARSADQADAHGDDDDEDDDAPWPITRQPPTDVEGWVDEIVEAFPLTAQTPPLRTVDGPPYVLRRSREVLPAAVVLALHRRGATVPGEAIDELIAVLGTMGRDLAGMGPEWASMQQVPPLAFSIAYTWAHLVIGHLDEDRAMAVVQACSVALDRFPWRPPAAGKPAADPARRQEGRPQNRSGFRPDDRRGGR